MPVALRAAPVRDARAEQLNAFWNTLNEAQKETAIAAETLFGLGFDTWEIARLMSATVETNEPAIVRLLDAFREVRRS